MSIAAYLRLIQVGHDPVGSLDVAAGARYSVGVSGWARDPDGGPVEVDVWVDGQWGASTEATLPRPDVGSIIHADDRVGYSASVAVPAGARTVCAFAINAAGTAGTNVELGCRGVVVGSDAPADPLPDSADWLTTVNFYRAASGLPAVVEDPSWTAAIMSHLVYLWNTPASLMTGAYASFHSENPASPYYSAAGAAAGGSSILGGGPTQRAAIEEWLQSPFHGSDIIEPGASSMSYAEIRQGGRSEAGLKVTSAGAEPPNVRPVFFPGNGAVVRMRAYSGGELPSPLETCGYKGFPGLPLAVLLPSTPPASGITATLQLPWGPTISGSDTANTSSSDLCVETQYNYRSSDTIYGGAGGATLAGAREILLIPRQRLTPGTHRVTISVPGEGQWSWSFAVTDCAPTSTPSFGCESYYDG